MAEAKGRRGKGANAPVSDSVKTSITIGRKLHSRWQAAASLLGVSANALAAEALDAATKWVVIHDKRRSTDHVETDDRLEAATLERESAPESTRPAPGLTVVPTAPTRGAV